MVMMMMMKGLIKMKRGSTQMGLMTKTMTMMRMMTRMRTMTMRMMRMRKKRRRMRRTKRTTKMRRRRWMRVGSQVSVVLRMVRLFPRITTFNRERRSSCKR